MPSMRFRRARGIGRCGTRGFLGDRNDTGVAFEEANRRQLPDGGEIHCFVPASLIHGAFADKRRGDTPHLVSQSSPLALSNDARESKIYVWIKELHVPASIIRQAGCLAKFVGGHLVQIAPLGDAPMVPTVVGRCHILRR